MSSKTSSFTLLETLITIGILAIVSAVVILIMNPSEFLKEARDSTRLSDLRNVHTALKLYEIDRSGFLGTSSIVYVSLPDTTTTCANLGLPGLPSGWTYNCVTSANLRKIDGLGWIPVNFASITYNSPIGKLPVDPVNTTSSGNYYTYVTGGSWKISARFESIQYTAQVATDGGSDPALYEFGSNLSLALFVGGQVGYWSFDETGTTTATDYSGYANHGTMYSSTTITDIHTSSGCQRGSCASFDGTDDYVNYGNAAHLNNLSKFTLISWILMNERKYIPTIINKGPEVNIQHVWWGIRSDNTIFFELGDSTAPYGLDYSSSAVSWNLGQWYFVAVTLDNDSKEVKHYRNDAFINTVSSAGRDLNSGSYVLNIGRYYGGSGPTSYNFNGKIDDIYIYNRALSAAEIQAIYNSTR